MKQDATKFAWGKLTATVTVGSTARNILGDYKHLTVDIVRIHMNRVFESKAAPSTTVPTTDPLVAFAIDPANENTDKPIFYQRIRAHMIGLRILASIDDLSLVSPKLHQKKYVWTTAAGDQFYMMDLPCYRFVLRRFTQVLELAFQRLRKIFVSAKRHPLTIMFVILRIR